MIARRIRCECGRVYEPAKHDACPSCGAETNVAVIELPKPAPPQREDELLVRQETDERGDAGKDAKPSGITKNTMAMGAGIAVLLLVVLIIWLARGPAPNPPSPTPTPSPAQTATPAPSASSASSATATALPSATPILTPPPAYGGPQSMIAPQSFDLAAAIASASPGATIKVPPGFYQGGVVITKPVRLAATGGQSYIQSDGRECLSVKSPGVFVQGMQFMCNGIGELPAISVANGAELELDGCRITSSTALGLTTNGNASVSAIGTNFTTNGGVAFRLQGGKATVTQSTFADSKIGLYAMNGGTAELKSCAFERTGTGDAQGGIIFVTTQGASVSATDCHFTGNSGGISVTNSASFTATNCEFKDNGANLRVAYGMIALSGGSKGTITGTTFEDNRIGVAVNDRGVLEMDQCTFTNNGIQSRQFILSTMPISITGQGSRATIRNTKIDTSPQFGIAMLDHATATLETVEISRAKVMGIGAGDTGSAPVQIEIRDSHIHHNVTGLGLYAGSTGKLENTEFRENQDGAMIGDKNTQLEVHKGFFNLNSDHGLCVFSEARAVATESQFEGNQRGAQSGLPRKSTGHASLTIEDSQVGANHVFGVGCYATNELILRRLDFDGDDKQNIYKERNANVQVEEAEAKASPTPEGEASASPEEGASPEPSASPTAGAKPTGTPSKSKQRQQRQKTHRPEDDATRILRHIFGPH